MLKETRGPPSSNLMDFSDHQKGFRLRCYLPQSNTNLMSCPTFRLQDEST